MLDEYKVGHYYQREYKFATGYGLLNNTIIFKVVSLFPSGDKMKVIVMYDTNLRDIPYNNILYCDFKYSDTVEVSRSKLLAKVL